MAKIYTTDGQVLIGEPANRKFFELEELQEVVGGYIELVELPDDMLMVVNEEGIPRKLPLNVLATAVTHRYGIADKFNGGVRGNVIICKKGQIQ